MNDDVLKLLEEALADPASAKQRTQQLRAENDALLAAMPEDERRIKKTGAEVIHVVSRAGLDAHEASTLLLNLAAFFLRPEATILFAYNAALRGEQPPETGDDDNG